MSMFTSIYDYLTGYDENTDPNSYKNQKMRLDNPKPVESSPFGRSVPVIEILKPRQPAPDSPWFSIGSSDLGSMK